MFGYITVCGPELKVKELARYRAYYCGLCRELGEGYGAFGQLTLTYDMTFLVILLTSLYECPTEEGYCRCRVHPIRGRAFLRNEITGYAADLNVLLAYYQMKDDWDDDRSPRGLAGMAALRLGAARAAGRYPKKSRAIARGLYELAGLEQAKSRDLDRVSGCFGRVAAELFAWREDHWQPVLRRLGFYLGKFIYLMDAYEDLQEDLEKGRYNPLEEMGRQPGYEERIHQILSMMMAECSSQFERLPCLEEAGILRNILYMGVWNRDRKLREAKAKEQEEEGKKL